jgi:hypothetical protein
MVRLKSGTRWCLTQVNDASLAHAGAYLKCKMQVWHTLVLT